MVLMVRKCGFLFFSCSLLLIGLGNAEALEPGTPRLLSGTDIAASRIEPFVLAFVEDEAEKPVEGQPASADSRGGLTEFQEKALIVAIAILIAFVIAWKLAGRSQEDIQRLLNRSKKGSNNAEEAAQKTDTELPTAKVQETKPDTVPEIPVVSEDTEHDLPASDAH